MRELKITQDQYNELCCAGKIHFVNHNVWCVNWLTFYEMLAVCQDVNTEECSLIKLVVE